MIPERPQGQSGSRMTEDHFELQERTSMERQQIQRLKNREDQLQVKIEKLLELNEDLGKLFQQVAVETLELDQPIEVVN